VSLSAFAAGALTIAVLQTSVGVPPEATAEFTQLEEAWNQAHLRGDAAALDRLWTDDIVVVVPKMPPFTKAEALSVFRSGRMRFTRYATSDIVVRKYDACAVVTGRLVRSRSMGERVLDDDWRFTKVYVRGPEGWRVASFHASDAGP
jgi:ketosteroid isomerase-like protein